MKCSFCDKEIAKGTGKIFVRKDAKVFNFHAKKCERNMLNLHRDARKFKWTNSFVKGTVVTNKKEASKKEAK
ncbi:MAG: 50S ribosomal protein L24e [Candidatus Nanoarchaeia archaeon]|nr:50S ribosomal protein L24e [Candidatus Nanoarchaeia archaeon]